MPEKKYGWCPSCLRLFALKQDGSVYDHNRSDSRRDAPYAVKRCEGGSPSVDTKGSTPEGRETKGPDA
jgi:hypothetical protein